MERHECLDCTNAVNEPNNGLRNLLVIWEGYIIEVYEKIFSRHIRKIQSCGLTRLYGQDTVEKDIEAVSE